MSEVVQEPIVEQTSDDNKLEVSVDKVENTPTENNEKINKDQKYEKPQLDYLSAELFNNVRQVTYGELEENREVVELSEEIHNRYKSSLTEITENEIITGRIIGINEKDVLVDIGFKSEGIISRNEFSENNLPDIGEKLEVFLEKIEDESGNTVLSKEKAEFLNRWKDLRNIHETGEIIKGKIIRRIKGGMVVDLGGVQAFLPGSQIDIRPVKDFDQYINKEIDLRVVKFNEMRKNVVVSHKAIIEDTLAEQRDELFSKLEVGSVIDGRVKNITDFGVFVDLGGIDGLLHITDLSWGRINHPSEIINMDDTLTVKIIDFDQDKKRVSLGLKQLTPHPWENIQSQYPEGSSVSGKVVSMTNYGAFIEIKPGIEGLIHISEMSWTKHIKNPSELYSLGDTIDAKVLAIDADERKISLGAKQLQPDPWDEIEEKYIPGNLVKGKVINLTQFGAFIELEEGIDGLIHVSDLSWTKIVRHPKEILGKNEEIEVRILEVSRESRRISLGIKQIEDDPWPGLSKAFQSGKKVEGEIVRVLDKGIILGLEHDLEGIIPFSRQIKRNKKSISSKYKIGDKMSAVVMEIKSDDKKVILFVEELSGEKSSEKDNVKQFLDNQSEPVGEKIEIPIEDLDQASDINED
ncbi:MAG: 30S ribosomal protein S1 [Candidatus Marinimicrobia bacterium]|nr:30S ribosomal protein S1 [Candidatus Neomarinimicrobiota bacterium]